MKTLSESEIRASFGGCTSGERKRLRIPDFAEVDWDSLDFLSWISRSNAQTGYLVSTDDDGRITGLVLHATTPGNSPTKQSMCSLCRTVHSLGGVTLFSTTKWSEAGRHGDTVGDYICTDLSCSAYVRGLKQTGRTQMPVTLTVNEKIAELQLYTALFVERAKRG